MTPEQESAIRDASDILRTEANDLASFMETRLKMQLTLRNQDVVGLNELIPPRAQYAVHKEMQRLRAISTTLLQMLPVEPEEEDEG